MFFFDFIGKKPYVERQLYIAVDFDNTLIVPAKEFRDESVQYDEAEIAVLREFLNNGQIKAYLFTSREGEWLDKAIRWIKEQNLNIVSYEQFISEYYDGKYPQKPLFDVLIDDLACGVPVCNNNIGWYKVDLLKAIELIKAKYGIL